MRTLAPLLLLSILLLTAACAKKEESGTVYRDGQSPVAQVAEDDPEMAAAIRKGKDTLPEFIQALAAYQSQPASAPGQHFSIKVAYPNSKGGTEHIWVDVISYQSGTFKGTLGNEPLNLPTMKLGDGVEVPEKEVEDWIIADDKGITRGGFTAKLLMQREGSK